MRTDTSPKVNKDKEELEKNTPENNEILREIFRRGRETDRRELLAYEALPEVFRKKYNESALSEWLSRKRVKPFDPVSHSVLVDYAFENGFVDPRAQFRDMLKKVPDHFFFSLTLFMDIWLNSLDQMGNETLGLYRLWRPSLHWRGRFVLGMVEITRPDASGAIKVRQTQSYDGADDASVERNEVFEGYLLRKDAVYCMLATDLAQQSMRATFLHGYAFEGKGKRRRVQTFQGATLGQYGRHLYACSAYLERWGGDPADLKRQINLVEPDKVPRSVLQKLADRDTDEYYVRF